MFINFFRERRRGRETIEREKHWPIVPLIYAFIGWFLYVPCPGIESTTFGYWGDTITNWATWPGLMLLFSSHSTPSKICWLYPQNTPGIQPILTYSTISCWVQSYSHLMWATAYACYPTSCFCSSSSKSTFHAAVIRPFFKHKNSYQPPALKLVHIHPDWRGSVGGSILP